MPDDGRRVEAGDEPEPAEAEGEVHVLEVGAELFREAADAQEQVAAVEGAGPAGAEHLAAAEAGRGRRFAVAELAGEAAGVVAVAGAVDDQSSSLPRKGGGRKT